MEPEKPVDDDGPRVPPVVAPSDVKRAAAAKLGARIRVKREQRGIRQEDFALKIERHWSSVSRWERGNDTLEMSIYTLMRIAKELGMTVHELMRGIKGI